jgi:hypothetical protein
MPRRRLARILCHSVLIHSLAAMVPPNATLWEESR